jgi:hypothetical protein
MRLSSLRRRRSGVLRHNSRSSVGSAASPTLVTGVVAVRSSDVSLPSPAGLLSPGRCFDRSAREVGRSSRNAPGH